MASVLQTLNIASRAAGYGIDRTPKAPVGVSVEVHLENLGGGLTKLLERKKAEAGITLDHQPNSLEKLVS